MILTALRTGMRHVDLVTGRITVRQNVVNGRIGTPKWGKPREIPLGIEVRTALKEHRHLRGALVFCDMSGELLGTVDTRLPLWRACKKAGLRQIGWHALRHTFASHLVMRGASLKAGAARALVDPDDDAVPPSRARGSTRLFGCWMGSGREWAERA
jgi:integrase